MLDSLILHVDGFPSINALKLICLKSLKNRHFTSCALYVQSYIICTVLSHTLVCLFVHIWLKNKSANAAFFVVVVVTSFNYPQFSCLRYIEINKCNIKWRLYPGLPTASLLFVDMTSCTFFLSHRTFSLLFFFSLVCFRKHSACIQEWGTLTGEEKTKKVYSIHRGYMHLI